MVRTPDWLLERRKRAERALATAREILGIDVTTAEDGAGWSGRTTPRNDSPRRSADAPNEGDTGKAQCLGLSLRFVILARQFSHPKEARRFSRGLSFARLPESWQPVPCVDVDVEHERLVALAVRVCA
jgi:hypothetical protein